MLHNLIASRPSMPRLDLTLVAFAAAGIAVATLMPPRADLMAEKGSAGASNVKSYAIAISAGDAMTLAAGSATVGAAEPGGRVLACRHVLSFGPLDIGQRCKPSSPIRLGAAVSE